MQFRKKWILREDKLSQDRPKNSSFPTLKRKGKNYFIGTTNQVFFGGGDFAIPTNLKKGN